MFNNVSSIRFIRICSIAIMVIAAVLSFGHQRELLLTWGVDWLGAIATPITVDLLAIICTLGIHTEGIAKGGRRAAISVLIIAGLASCSTNFIAGGTLGSKIVNVWSVAAYLLSEWVAAKVKGEPKTVDARRSVAAKKAAATRAANRQKAESQGKRRRVAAAVAEGNVVPMRTRAAAS